ncbi:MAG: CmpA/NrtA family ABC transporter substrate-binding protein [Pseudomonadales bacterium]
MNTTRSWAEKTTLDVGYLRLTDAAPFIVACELGIFEEHGLTVNLHQEISWANIRDKLVSGRLDAAQMLAPLPAMSTLGASGLRAPVLTGLVLSSNGNAITLNSNLSHEATALIARGTVSNMPQALIHIAAERGSRPTLATVHAFSTHTILVRRWLSQHGVHPDKDVSTLVVPPSQMVDSLQAGIVDGYCVGEPWNTIAAVRGVGTTIALGQQIWPDAPEKVLGVSAEWHDEHPHTHLRLRQSLLQACGWLAEPDHLSQVARMLAQPHYLDVPPECLFPAPLGRSSDGLNDVVMHRFYGREINRPDHERALALIRGCGDLLGTPLSADAALALAQQSWRPDLYEQTLAANAALLGDLAPT